MRKQEVFKSHHDLDLWKKSIDFVTDIYNVTKSLPNDEKFALINQLRRAAVSVPSNIAEGASRQSNKEFIQLLYIVMGSLSEIETQLIICKNLKYLAEIHHLHDKIIDLKKMTNGLIKYLKSKD